MGRRSGSRWFGGAGLLVALGLPLVAGTAEQAELSEGPAETPPRPVARAGCEIEIDGVLDEPCWADAAAFELDWETAPRDNVEAPVPTSCLITFDHDKLLVGCRAIDPDPAQIRARLSDRDRAFNDDFVGVVLDTFNDERRAFEFFVNPLGVQMDLIQDDVNGSEDSSWDAIWHSAGQINERGYEVEMAIPFSSLRFQRGEGDQIWGLDIVRIYPRNHRVRIGLNRLDRDVDCYLCQTTKIEGFEGAEPGKNLEVAPTLTVTRADEQRSFPNGSLEAGDTETEPGITARWGFTNNLTLLGTINPDFSQVEADVARLDINEEFALFFPEKRPFFLEGSDYFDTPISAVYTRTVAEPAWGAKVTGKEGKNVIGFYAAQDDRTNLLFPGTEGSDIGTIEEENLAGVFRYRRDLSGNSAVGALATVREGDEYSNRVVGVDTMLRPTSTDTIRAQFLASQTEYPDGVVTDFDQPEGSFEDRAFELSYRHSTRNWMARAFYSDYGEDFRADSGFVPRVGHRFLVAGGEYRWIGEGDDWYTSIELGGDWDQTTDQQGNLIERELEGWFNFGGPLQSFFFVGSGVRDQVYNEVDFDQTFIATFGQVRPWSDLFLALDVRYGDRVDFGYAPQPGEARQGRQLDITPEFRLDLGRHLRLTMFHNYRRFDLDEGELFEANLTEMRLVYQFNVRAFVRAIAQYSKIYRNQALYDGVVAEDDEDVFVQLLYNYKVNPQTALYVGYTDQRANTGLNDDGDLVTDSLTPVGRSFFVKIGYAWVP